MSGTRINNLKLVKVVDGDTIKVELDGEVESLRLCCLDTEESLHGSSKPVTNAGKLASKWAKGFFEADEDGLPRADIRVHIEFDTNDPVTVCLKKHRGNYNRLICYVYKDGMNYNIQAVRQGWSPYFVKYGRSRLYHNEFLAAEMKAQAESVGIWDPAINAGGESRDYDLLLPWWHLRDSVVEGYRKFGIQGGVKSVRLDYEEILDAAKAKSVLTVFCDLQKGINKWPGDAALIYAGSPTHKFNLWIPDIYTPEAQQVLNVIETRYSGFGRGYVYVTGEASLYNGRPQIVIEDIRQISDIPPGQG